MRFSGKDEWLPRRSPPRATLGICLALLALQLLAWAQQKNAPEDQVKAAYLLNFAKLAEWPARALADAPAPLVIGVSGGDEDFLEVLKAVVAGKVIGGHPLLVKRVNSVEEMKLCHLVFFRASEKRHTQADMEALIRPGLLLVGEDDSFLRQGGMVNLVRDHGTIRFEVNSDALDRSEIHFSSKILALAKAGSGTAPPTPTNTASTPEGPRRLERNTPPEYPEIAERMKLTGTAQVQALVKPDGSVKEVKVLGGHPLLADALARAVMQWKYQAGPKETVEVVKFSFGPQ
jgi:TonB family protein